MESAISSLKFNSLYDDMTHSDVSIIMQLSEDQPICTNDSPKIKSSESRWYKIGCIIMQLSEDQPILYQRLSEDQILGESSGTKLVAL